jgi:hypothetical protein
MVSLFAGFGLKDCIEREELKNNFSGRRGYMPLLLHPVWIDFGFFCSLQKFFQSFSGFGNLGLLSCHFVIDRIQTAREHLVLGQAQPAKSPRVQFLNALAVLLIGFLVIVVSLLQLPSSSEHVFPLSCSVPSIGIRCDPFCLQ